MLRAMQIEILAFGMLRSWLGADQRSMEVREELTVAELVEMLAAERPLPLPAATIAVGVNACFVTSEHVLQPGDEVALLPPVSGGAPEDAGWQRLTEGIAAGRSISALTMEPIPVAQLVAAVRADEDGAVVTFDGVVRNQTRGRRTLHLDYEAYEAMARRQMDALVADALARFEVRQAVVIHRLGRLEVGQTSVLIVVAGAHRAAVYEASRWLIDTLKREVPIWKQETFEDGVVWAAGEPFPESLALGERDA